MSDDTQPPDAGARDTDETLREKQAGKGYGEDEGERDAAVEEDAADAPPDGG